MKKLTLLLLLSLWAVILPAETKITGGSFDDFECFIMENDSLIVKAVPAINRIVSIERKDCPGNILWFGKSTKYPGWLNYGGSKVWPGPQSQWASDFPPLPELDQRPGTAKIGDHGTLQMTTPDCPQYGTRFAREIALDGDRVMLTESLTNIGKAPIRWTIWEVSQYVTGGTIIVSGVSSADQLTFVHTPLLTPPVSGRRGIEITALPQQRYAKIIHPDSTKFVEYRVNGLCLIRQSQEPSHTESYIGNGYVELESVSKPMTLAPGETRSFCHEWTLQKE